MFLLQKIVLSIRLAISKYTIDAKEIDLLLVGRPWLSADDFNIPLDKVTEVLDSNNEQEVFIESNEINLTKKIKNLTDYEYKDVIMDNYGKPLLDINNNLIGYLNPDTLECVSVKIFYNENNLLSNKVEVREYDFNELSFKNDVLVSWIDTRTDNGFIREYNNKRYYYNKNNKLINFESTFNCTSFPKENKDINLNEKIATIDFETYGDSNYGLGLHQVYAAGFAIKSNTELHYIEPLENSSQFINRFFYNILMNYDLDGYTIYAHNLGRFDSIFIIKSLVLNKDINIKPVWKDNSILSLTIEHLNTKIILLDSLQLIPDKLENILNSFNSKFKKGNFPHNFVNKKNLFYKGIKPSKDFYNNISELEYSEIPENNWNLKKETLSYLKSDVEGLLDVAIKFNRVIFKKYNLNMTKFKTLPSLALAVYRSSYLPENIRSELKILKGEIEREIRTSYFGGNVEIFMNETSNSYLYDLNSQYSKAMLNDMPVGNPILSLETNLNSIFGFTQGEITCPNENTLQVPFIQYRDPITNMVSCPRGKFTRLIFSEEIKYALKYGYSIKINYSYQFKRGKTYS